MTRPLGYERVYLPLYKVADTPFHIRGDGECVFTGCEDTLYTWWSFHGVFVHMTLAQHMETGKISTVENNTAVQRQIIQYLLTFSSKRLLPFDFALQNI